MVIIGDKMKRMSFYDLMNQLDKFCITYQDLDFRDLKVSFINGLNLELLVIQNRNGKIIETISICNQEEEVE